MTPWDKWQRSLTVLMLVAILITAAAPTPRCGTGRVTEPMFYLAEEDYNTPFMGSYLWLRALPFQSESFAGFAGYEQYGGHYSLGERQGLAHVVQFAGDLVGVAGLEFLAREDPRKASPGPRVYLSETFWRQATGGSFDILGQQLTLDGQTCRVAGILRETTGYFAGTEIWAPLRVTEQAARTESLRIVGRMRAGATWKEAQRELTRLARRQPAPLNQLGSCKMIPASGPITFVRRETEFEIVSRHARVWEKDS